MLDILGPEVQSMHETKFWTIYAVADARVHRPRFLQYASFGVSSSLNTKKPAARRTCLDGRFTIPEPGWGKTRFGDEAKTIITGTAEGIRGYCSSLHRHVFEDTGFFLLPSRLQHPTACPTRGRARKTCLSLRRYFG